MCLGWRYFTPTEPRCGAAWCRPKGTGSCEGNLQERHEKELLSLGYLEPAWPQLVDVDGDGKMELLLMVTDGDGSWNVSKKSWIRYFRQVDGQLVEQFGANNVFRHVNFTVKNWYGAPCFAVVDWDSDGDLDLILQDNAGLWLMDFDMVISTTDLLSRWSTNLAKTCSLQIWAVCGLQPLILTQMVM